MVDTRNSWDVCDVSVLYSCYLCLLLLGEMQQNTGSCYFVTLLVSLHGNYYGNSSKHIKYNVKSLLSTLHSQEIFR